MEAYDLSQITSADFTPYLQQPVAVHFDENTVVQSVISKVTEFNNYSPLERKSFSIELKTTGDQVHRPQGIYRMIHPSGKFLDIFLVPVARDADGMRYEAVFS